ncbi:hypothetical protein WDW89_22730 [Deltaproteobacteria bacterium TL4]
MERKHFLQVLNHYTLVNYSLLKRLFPQDSLKAIKDMRTQAERAKLIHRHVFQGFECFSLTALGFQTLGIQHHPQYSFTEQLAQRICTVNQLRFGIEKELSHYRNLNLIQWIGGGNFGRRPLITRFEHESQQLKPEGLATIQFPDGEKRLYFIHYWRSFEQISRDLLFYFLYQARNEHLYRFHYEEGTLIRVLCVIPSYKQFYEVQPQIEQLKGAGITLFIPESKVQQEDPLETPMWVDRHGEKRKVL